MARSMARSHSFKRQLQTTHLGAGGWEPHGSSSTVCAGKVETPWERGWVVSSVASRFYSRLTSTSIYFFDILKKSTSFPGPFPWLRGGAPRQIQGKGPGNEAAEKFDG